MTTTLLPGAASKLHRLGVPTYRLGRVWNTAPTINPDDVDKLPVPKNSDELAEMFADDKRFSAVMGSRDALRNFIDRYAKQAQAPDSDLKRELTAELQKELANMLRANDQDTGRSTIARLSQALDPQARTNMLTTHKQATAYNPRAVGVVADKFFNSAGEFISTIWHHNTNSATVAKRAEILNAFGTVSPSDGGFLVPETLRSQLLQIALEKGVVRPRATVVPMEAPRVPFPMIDATSNVSSVYGGMVGYWGEEGATLTDSSAKFGRVVLDAKKLTGLSAVPNELLADSLISFSALIERLWPDAIAFFEDVAFMVGSGVGEPLGYTGATNPAAIGVSAETGQATQTIVLENIIKMYSRMLPASLNNGIWVCSPNCLPELFTLALSVGTGGAPVMLSNVAGAAPVTIFGRPLIVSEKAQTLGTRGDIVFVDLSYYLVGDRQSMSMSSSTDYNFGSDKTTFRIIQRVDGRPWIASAITPRNNSSTLSPFVELATR